MKKLINKKNIYWIVGIVTLLFIINYPLMSKNIITADVLLNNSFYNGYSWEVSLGRFGLFALGIFKSYISVPFIDLIISYLLISFSLILIFDLFEIKKFLNRIIIILVICISPIISATLIFNYCSVGYLLAFFLSILSLYIYYNCKNRIFKIIVPIILLVVSLSMYQAYLSLIISVFVFYNMRLIITKKIDYKKIVPYIFMILGSVGIYFILMKLSLFVLHIDAANYSNANSIGISTILSLPSKFIDSYKLTYQFFFTDIFMKNSFMHNNILYIVIGLFAIIYLLFKVFSNKLDIKNIIILLVLVLLIPVFINSVIFVISDSKLQLLMSASYLMISIFIISILDNSRSNIIFIIGLCLLLRNYFVQIQATYLSLDNTFNKYYTVIGDAINNNINNLDKRFVVVGNVSNNDSNSISDVYKYNYGYISDDGIFWDEYNLRKIGFERFCYEYYGVNVSFGTVDEYEKYLNKNSNKLIENEDDLIIINFNNFNKNI